MKLQTPSNSNTINQRGYSLVSPAQSALQFGTLTQLNATQTQLLRRSVPVRMRKPARINSTLRQQRKRESWSHVRTPGSQAISRHPARNDVPCCGLSICHMFVYTAARTAPQRAGATAGAPTAAPYYTTNLCRGRQTRGSARDPAMPA